MSHSDTSSDKAITIFTIGFAGKSAEEFFGKLKKAGVRRLIDVRLNNVSQLAGFTKKRDLEYFLKVIADIEYLHFEDLAPTQDILSSFKKMKAIDWADYERCFTALLEERKPEEHYSPEELDRACLLCSEPTHEHCHRRLVVERLREKWGHVEVVHL